MSCSYCVHLFSIDLEACFSSIDLFELLLSYLYVVVFLLPSIRRKLLIQIVLAILVFILKFTYIISCS
jgi:hypothetical protein